MEEIKIPEIIDYTKEKHMLIYESISKLRNLCDKYFSSTASPSLYEELKLEFLAELGTFTERFSGVKAFKSGSHVYLEEQRKKLKSDAIDLMMREGVKRTVAEGAVYSVEYYVTRVNLIEKLKAQFIKFELLLDYYNRVLDSIIQSASIASKEFNHTKSS